MITTITVFGLLLVTQPEPPPDPPDEERAAPVETEAAPEPDTPEGETEGEGSGAKPTDEESRGTDEVVAEPTEAAEEPAAEGEPIPEEPTAPSFDSIREAVNQQDFVTANAQMEAMVNDDPTSTRLLRLAASVAFMAQDYSRAAGYLERVLALDPNDDPSRLNLARARMMLGHKGEAMQSVDAVLSRHPQLPEGVELRAQIESGGPAGKSKVTPIARADIGIAYDSELFPGADAAPAPNQPANGGLGSDDALLLSAEAAAGVAVDMDVGSFNVMGRLVSRNVLTDREDLKALAPTAVEIAALQRFGKGDMVGAIDFRYQELFTNFFNTHVQRLVAPTLWGSYRFGELSTVRLLGGVSYRDPDNSATPKNITANVGLRDTIDLGRIDLILDVTGRMNVVTSEDSDDDADTTAVDFMEIGALGFVTYAPAEVVQLFALVGANGRQFDNSVATEATYSAGGGIRFFFHPFELHADYTLTKNVSGGPRDFTRHQASVGVRAWWQ